MMSWWSALLTSDELTNEGQYFEEKHKVIDQSFSQLKDVDGNSFETTLTALTEVRQ